MLKSAALIRHFKPERMPTKDNPRFPIYSRRVLKELRLIEANDFTDYFEQVIEILAMTTDIQHIVRGSAGSSLVCFLTAITNIDPIAEDIPLSRFMHAARSDKPDIDIDFPHNRRDEVIERVRRRYPGRVARVSNYVTYQPKSAIREAIRKLGYTEKLPQGVEANKVFTWDQCRAIEREAEALLGKHRYTALHCGGIVITPDILRPDELCKPGQLKYNKDDAEDLGYVKLDLLCNRGLTQLIDIDPRPVEDYPPEDEATADLLCRGDTVGITFGESPAFRKALVAIRPRCRSDIAIALGIIRPAAAEGGRKDDFLNHWQQYQEHVGIVYDDDAINLIAEVIGCSDSQAELFRKAFAKRDEAKMEEFANRLGDHPDRAQILVDLSYMRSYSFCKSHAISYCYLVWALAYHKAHNRRNFWPAVLNHVSCSMYRPWVHYSEAIQSGWEFEGLRPPFMVYGGKLVSSYRDKKRVEIECPREQFRSCRYWVDHKFRPDTRYERRCEDENGEPYRQPRIYVKGLIATSRCFASRRSGNKMTFVTLGGNGKYYDVVLPGFHKLGWVDAIECWGKEDIYLGSPSIRALGANYLKMRPDGSFEKYPAKMSGQK